MEVNIDGISLPGKETLDQIKRGANYCMEEEGLGNENVEVSLSFVDSKEIKELNVAYRGVEDITDVLSFPQFESSADIPEEGFALLGDVVICLDRALEQAIEYGHTPEREIVFLFVHSMFHLLGYDHQCDEEQSTMRKKEETIMSRIGLERG
jgi:probable rRNA maturation factor